jgi:hypothetical protein
LQLELLIDHEPSATREEVEAESRREPITEPREGANSTPGTSGPQAAAGSSCRVSKT